MEQISSQKDYKKKEQGLETYQRLKGEFNSIMDSFETESNKSISKKLDSLLQEIDIAKSDLNKRRTALFFPRQSSKLKVEREAGLLEERTAIEFLSSPQTHDAIIQRLINCMELGQIDYMSFIFNRLIPQIPKSESELQRLSKDKSEFFRTLKTMYEKFPNRSGIQFFDKQLELISVLQRRILELSNSINKGN